MFPAAAQKSDFLYKNRDNHLTWWDRINNEYSWIRNRLGTRYKFEKSVGVVIAIDDYTGDFDDLGSPVKDAERVKNFLLEEAGFDEVYMLTNDRATSSNIRKLMEETLSSLLGVNDRLLVYWSGHGGSARDTNGRAYGFLALQNGSRDGRRDSIYMDEARSWLRRIRARQVLIVIDACYSGLSLQMASDLSDPTWEQMAGPGHHLLTSSSSNQVSYGYTDGSGGLFTTAFLEGARGAADFNKDGIATVTEIAAHLETRLSSATGLGYVQTPQFGTIGRQEGRFFFPSGHTPTPVVTKQSDNIQKLGDDCSAANSDYELFVRGAKACWEVEAFIDNHSNSASCTAVRAATVRKLALCSQQDIASRGDPCSSVIPPDGMECIVDPSGRAAFTIIEKSVLKSSEDPMVLRIQTHYSPETVSGRAVTRFAKKVETTTGGQVTIEVFYSSSVVRSVETFDAAAAGILDCDMTGAGYQTGKDIAFQLVGDIFGAYETPAQQLFWLEFSGAEELVQELYGRYGMHFVGWWISGPESLSSSVPIRNLNDVKGFRFRSPPGIIQEVWQELGADPIVIDFTEIFTALETGVLSGADASNLVNNLGLGLYDISNHATYPGFHSMPADHLACNKSVWDSLSAENQMAITSALHDVATELAKENETDNENAAIELEKKGVKLHDWSKADRRKFRETALLVMERFASRSDIAKRILDSHRRYMTIIGLIG